MSTAVEINGNTLVPIKEAALRVKYSRDYVSRLAREGKIVASQVGRQWFVDLASLERFALEASSLEAVRKEELRLERKRELMAKESLATLDVVVRERSRRHRFNAVAMSATVACLGLMVGVGVYATKNFLSAPTIVETSAVRAVALNMATEESPFKVIAEPTEILVTSITAVPTTAEGAIVEPLTADHAEGIFLLTNSSLSDEDSVSALFSDPVEVNFSDDREGVVSYDRGDGVVTEYPFVRIPTAVEGEVMSDPQE